MSAALEDYIKESDSAQCLQVCFCVPSKVFHAPSKGGLEGDEQPAEFLVCGI